MKSNVPKEVLACTARRRKCRLRPRTKVRPTLSMKIIWKGTNFMSAQAKQSRGQVAKGLYSNGIASAHERQNGRYSQISFYNHCALGTFIGNPDNEYERRKRHRYRLSKNLRTLHCPL